MKSFKQYIKNELSEIYSEEELHIFSFLILEKVTGFSKTQVLANSGFILSENQRTDAVKISSRLKNSEPIQYILGECDFYGLKFKVNTAVLIPRPETEELMQWIIKDLPLSPLKGELLDIGTGSGCIAISLKKEFPDLTVSAMDISSEALKISKENAMLNGVEINFIQSDILKISQLDRKYDLIVSNPPYIPERDKKTMESNVLDFEPHIALFVSDEDPLIFYRKIAELATNHLTENGSLYFEIHNGQGENCKKLLQSLGFKSITLRKDISGIDRMICAKL
jgi:release factor glutamine methyltransferase